MSDKSSRAATRQFWENSFKMLCGKTCDTPTAITKKDDEFINTLTDISMEKEKKDDEPKNTPKDLRTNNSNTNKDELILLKNIQQMVGEMYNKRM